MPGRVLGRTRAGRGGVAPVGRVEFADRKPYPVRRGEWVWRPAEGFPGAFSNVVPRAVFDHLIDDRWAVAVTYPSRKEAVAALSAACLAFARAGGVGPGTAGA